jgi:hypothetical protein
MNADIDDDWREIFRIAGGQVAPAQIAETVAVKRGQRGTWPWVGLFILLDGRVAYVWGHQSRAGWQDVTSERRSHARVVIARSVDEAMAHVGGDFFVLNGQYLAWCTRRSARALLSLLEAKDETGWRPYALQTPGTSECVVLGYVADVARAQRRDEDVQVVSVSRARSFSTAPAAQRRDEDVQAVSAKNSFGMIVSSRYLVDYHPAPPVSPLPRGPVPESKKRCESCKKDYSLDVVPEAERKSGREGGNDFWRCDECMQRLYTMLNEMSQSFRPRLFTRRDKMRETLVEYEQIYARADGMPSERVRVVVEKLHALDIATCPRADVDRVFNDSGYPSGYTMICCTICAGDVEEAVRFNGEAKPVYLCSDCVQKMRAMFGVEK